MPLIVHVTAEDIQAGYANDCYRCPVALALQRATGDRTANVYEDEEFLMRCEVDCRYYLLPCDVTRFVRDFDQGADLQPFSSALPDVTSWQQQCAECDEYVDAVDDSGLCETCGE